MTVLQWTEAFELKNARMDETHREFVEFLNTLDALGDAEFVSALDRFIEHTEAHFAQEDRWMKRTNFAPVNCHSTEHSNVLEIAREVRRRVAGGDLDIGRRLIKELGPWFANHAETMDAALAFHIGSVGFDTTREEFTGPIDDAARALLEAQPLASCGTSCSDAHAHGAQGHAETEHCSTGQRAG